MPPFKRKKLIDSRDREILRFLKIANRPQTGHQIAKKINISPPAIKPRLDILRNKGIIKKISQGNIRTFKRSFNSGGLTKPKLIRAPSKIMWGLDIKRRNQKDA